MSATTEKLSVVVLVDNKVGSLGLVEEHGLSFWVTSPGGTFLLDTGQGRALGENAARLGIDLADAEAVVLSHGHYDHTGGMSVMFGSDRPLRVFMHPAALSERYSLQPAAPHKFIGMPPEIAKILAARPGYVKHTFGPTQIAKNAWVTGPIPRLTEFEDTGGAFFIDKECSARDPLADDQAVWLESARGIVVLLGCAHSGVINTLDHIARITGTRRFHAVLGGMHLLHASSKRLRATADAFRRYEVELLAPGHCTGEAPMVFLREQFSEQYRAFGTGSTFTWEV